MQVDRTAPQAHPGLTLSEAVRIPAASANVLWLGLVLVTVSWTLAWFGPEPVRWYTFFPLWLGYIVTVDGINLRRSGSSYLSRDPAGLVGLFLLSAPCWWIFEALNERLDNWFYRMPLEYSTPVYGLLASIAFSTVVPAIFETAELYRSFGRGRRLPRTRSFALRRQVPVALIGAGGVMLLLVVLFPEQAFPLAWISLVFVFDPVNALRGRRSLIAQIASGRWDTVLCLFLAGITCGFFWEMWNYWSVPSWEYRIPYVGFGKVFEMPILGYGGYFPFALEVYALWALVSAVLPGDQERLVRFHEPTSQQRVR